MLKKLTDAKVRKCKVKQGDKPLKLADGGGLILYVTQHGKYWRYNYRFQGKQKTLSIAPYPEMSLKDARLKHEEARELLSQQVDPSEHKQITFKLDQSSEVADSFEKITREWMAHNESGWSATHIQRNKSYLERDVFPVIGATSIREVDTQSIIRIMQRIERRGAGDAARRIKQVISHIYKYAITLGKARNNPASNIDNDVILKPRIKKHFAAITEPLAVGQLMRDINSYDGSFTVKCALKLSALVMLRPGELRGAEWSEIDLDAGMWTIPIKRMKAPTYLKKANLTVHYVPLSRQAIEILKDMQPLTGHYKFVFPSARGASRQMSENAVRAALRALGYENGTMTAHGFRGMASSLLNEKGWNPDAIERQLAHKERNQIRAAYNRTEYLPERIRMMQSWADYLDELRRCKPSVLPFERLSETGS